MLLLMYIDMFVGESFIAIHIDNDARIKIKMHVCLFYMLERRKLWPIRCGIECHSSIQTSHRLLGDAYLKRSMSQFT